MRAPGGVVLFGNVRVIGAVVAVWAATVATVLVGLTQPEHGGVFYSVPLALAAGVAVAVLNWRSRARWRARLVTLAVFVGLCLVVALVPWFSERGRTGSNLFGVFCGFFLAGVTAEAVRYFRARRRNAP